MSLIRNPYVAGMFYPDNPTELKDTITKFFDNVDVKLNVNKIGGIVSPHAGYVYSGQTAAYAYKQLKNKNYDTVIVISPSHREYFNGVSIYNGDAYSTPLGNIPVNKELREKLKNLSEKIFVGIEGHRSEHALEVQLPFLQMVLNEFSIVPIVIGDQSKEIVYNLGESLSTIINNNTLLVASSDLSHFYSKKRAELLDSKIINHINDYDYEELQNDLESRRCEACGGGAIVATLKALEGNGYNKSKVVAHSDSGDITRDESEVVGYLSALVYN